MNEQTNVSFLFGQSQSWFGLLSKNSLLGHWLKKEKKTRAELLKKTSRPHLVSLTIHLTSNPGTDRKRFYAQAMMAVAFEGAVESPAVMRPMANALRRLSGPPSDESAREASRDPAGFAQESMKVFGQWNSARLKLDRKRRWPCLRLGNQSSVYCRIQLIETLAHAGQTHQARQHMIELEIELNRLHAQLPGGLQNRPQQIFAAVSEIESGRSMTRDAASLTQ